MHHYHSRRSSCRPISLGKRFGFAAFLLMLFVGCSGSQEEPTGAAEELRVDPGASKRPHKNVHVVKHEITLKNGQTHTDASKVTFIAGEPFELNLRYRADVKSDGELPVLGYLVHKRRKGDEVIIDSCAGFSEKVGDGEYRFRGNLTFHQEIFVVGGSYVLRVNNQNGVFYEVPIKIVK